MSEPQLTPEELDRLIDGLLDGADDPQDATAARHGYALMNVAHDVRSLADEPIPTAVRDRHLATIRAAAAGPAPATATGRTGWMPTLRRRAAAIAAATSLAFSATGGGAVALAQDSNPGDPLYGVKRASEHVALAVTNDDARLHLSFAERRLNELEAVPDHAAELAPQAAEHLNQAQSHGASADEAGAEAVLRLSDVLAKLDPDKNGNAVIAVSRACDRIATRHGHDASTCGYEGESPGNSGDAPGQSEDGPGKSGEAPRGSSDGAPGRSEDAPAGRDDAGATGDEGARPDGAGPPDGVPGPGAEADPAD